MSKSSLVRASSVSGSVVVRPTVELTMLSHTPTCQDSYEMVGEAWSPTLMGDSLYASRRITPIVLSILERKGIKTIINLMRSDEPGFERFDEAAAGYHIETKYYPIEKDGQPSEVEVDHLMGVMDAAEKPLLIFCDDGARSSAVCCAYMETRSRTNMEVDGFYQDFTERLDCGDTAPMLDANRLSDSTESTPRTELQSFMGMYVQRKVTTVKSRRSLTPGDSGIFVGGQPTENELMDYKSNKGIKAIVNVRSVSEAGEFGLGILAREEKLVKNMGMEYLNLPLDKNFNVYSVLSEGDKAALEALPRPLLIHSSRGERAEKLATVLAGKDCSIHIDSVAPPIAKFGWRTWVLVFLTSALMGLLFGVAMESGKVTLPLVIRQQFLFQRFIMIKMFLSASSASAFFLGTLAILSPQTLLMARETFMGCSNGKGFIGVCGGTFILGMGMALGGACPGMVLVQVGSGVENSLVTLGGGLLAALVYGLLQPYIMPWLKGGQYKHVKLDDIPFFSKFPFWMLAYATSVMLMGGAGLFEGLWGWNTQSEIGNLGLTPWKNVWPPEISGMCIGFLQVPAVLFIRDTLGSSSSYMTLMSQLLVSTGLQNKFKHLNNYRIGLDNWWQLFYICFAIVGAYISSNASGTYHLAKGVRIGDSICGGFLMIFGSRMASGCTSGHGISGMGLLALHSIAAVPAMFAGGIVMAFIYNAVDTDMYIGALK